MYPWQLKRSILNNFFIRIYRLSKRYAKMLNLNITPQTTFTYSGDAVFDTFFFFPFELSLPILLCLALLFLAAHLNPKIHPLQQKEVALTLTRYFASFFFTQALLKFFFFNTAVFNQYFFATPYNLFLENRLILSGGALLYWSLRLIRINVDHPLREYPILFAFSLWFLELLVLSNHVIITFIGLVGFSLNLYVRISLFGPTTIYKTHPIIFNESARQEASIKYFYLSTFSSSFLLLTFLLFYFLARTGNWMEISWWIVFSAQPNTRGPNTRGALHLAGHNLKYLAILALLFAFAFKISAFPSHFWAPEVYQGSSNSVTSFIILPVKIAALGVFFLLLSGIFPTLFDFWGPTLQILGIGSRIVGALGAFTEKKIKRFLAFSSINQVGFRIVGFSATEALEGLQSALFFLIIYVLTNLLFFYFFLRVESTATHRPLIYLTDLNRIEAKNYKIRWSWSIVFFSLAGLPPFAGFFSKFYVLLVAQNNSQYLAVIVGIITSLISAYYYLRVVKLLWFENILPEPTYVFTGTSNELLDFFSNLVFCVGIGFFLTLSFLWNEALLRFSLTLAQNSSFLWTLGDSM